ncbi:MAG: hypothetical protein ACRDA5_14155 [Clostridium sp.]
MRAIKYMIKYFFEIVAILAIILFLFIPQLHFGVSKNRMEKDASNSHQIQSDWLTSSSVNDDLGAFIFYPEDISHHTFSIYQKGTGFLSFGYHFRYGGGLPVLNEEILKVETDGNGIILLSMNELKVAKIVVFTSLEDADVITIDSLKPFTAILPQHYSKIEIYDIYCNLIPDENIIINHI